ncbi:MAG: hypothetical protein KDE31_35760 [Caldilineaceae bacterium]|nr:hypothetical protein [Caldilineaceae bacterium]
MDLYTILKEAHSGWRYIVLLLLAVVIVKYVIGWLQKGQWTNLGRRLGLFTTIAVDIQMLLGLIIWGMLPMFIFPWSIVPCPLWASATAARPSASAPARNIVLLFMVVILVHLLIAARIRQASGVANR